MIFDEQITSSLVRSDRFQVIIDPRYALEACRIPYPIQIATFRASMPEHMDETIAAATSVYADGQLILELF